MGFWALLVLIITFITAVISIYQKLNYNSIISNIGCIISFSIIFSIIVFSIYIDIENAIQKPSMIIVSLVFSLGLGILIDHSVLEIKKKLSNRKRNFLQPLG